MALSISPWEEAARQLDERWLLTVDESTARERIAARHIRAGICATREAALHRADANDLPSGSKTSSDYPRHPEADALVLLRHLDGRFLLANVVQPAEIIESIDDERFIAST